MSLENIRDRRSVYALNKNMPIDAATLIEILEQIVLHAPSPFNNQSSRLVALLGAEHDKLWQITEDTLRRIVPAEHFASTEQKMAGFKAAAGTVLFYEDQEPVKKMQEAFPSYAENFPIWSEQTSGMHQILLWVELAALNVGANLQHYNPLIDEEVARTWNIPAHWTLRAQLVFGGISAEPGEKEFQPLEERLKIYGA